MAIKNSPEPLSSYLDFSGKPGRLKDDHLRCAIKALPHPLKQGEAEIANAIQGAMFVWCVFKGAAASQKARGVKRAPAASVAERKWNGLAKKLGDAIAALQEMHSSPIVFSDWKDAAEDIADHRHKNPPPHIGSSEIVYAPMPGGTDTSQIRYWDIDAAFTENFKSLDWFLSVTKRAEMRATQDKKPEGGPDRDSRDYDAIQNLAGVFKKATGGDADLPGYNPQEKKRTGWFLNFVEAVIQPLDGRNRGALASLIRRALGTKITIYDTRTNKTE